MLGLVKQKVKQWLLVHRPKVLLRRSLKLTKDPIKKFISYFCDADKISLDIGGATGGYALMMAPYSRQVYIFEPIPKRAAAIRQRFAALPERVILKEAALSDTAGTVTLRVPVLETGRSTIEMANPLKESDQIVEHEVERLCLDDLDLGPVGFMKVDVEGHEEAVFRGGMKTVERSRPVIFIEIEERHKPGATKTMFSLFDSLGYTGFFLKSGELCALEAFDAATHQKPGLAKGAYINNFMFFPDAGSADRMAGLVTKSQELAHRLVLP